MMFTVAVCCLLSKCITNVVNKKMLLMNQGILALIAGKWSKLTGLKENWSQSFPPVFMSDFCWYCRERSLYKVLRQFRQISRSSKMTRFCIQRMRRHTREYTKHINSCFLSIYCYFYRENNSYNKVLWCF